MVQGQGGSPLTEIAQEVDQLYPCTLKGHFFVFQFYYFDICHMSSMKTKQDLLDLVLCECILI